jgi:signal transduction histidine kinase/HAMP domain-containing protein/ActR/RegA family two-component response regulator
VANGDLTRKLSVQAKGEIAALADTINGMTQTLGTFAEQVTTVAREVGIEGKLGGQARVPGASGTWRDLVDNVNQLAGNLTTQVRAISDVATAVTTGDLTRTIDVEALGEVLALKDTINQMIANLRDTTRTNEEQDWLKTNLAKFTAMMQGQRSLESLAQLLMSELTPAVSCQIGTFFVLDEAEMVTGRPTLRLLSTYGYKLRKSVANAFAVGEGLVGQAALEKKPIVVSDVPDDYVHVTSSVGEAPPRWMVVLPVLYEGRVKAVIELGSFQTLSLIHLTFLEQLMLNVGVVFNMISASRRTEEVLQELQRSNTALGSRSRELEDKASQLEVKNREIAEASASLEEKAKELALVSRYKSEFLTNMSHELRTPLNSMLILSNLLAENQDGNLSDKQLEYARTVVSAGDDLLTLINQILDLSKIEAGKMPIERRPFPLADLIGYVERHFRPIAQQKNLEFTARVSPELPARLTTDSQRLEQILKNLLSNAFKFTDEGHVRLDVMPEHDPRRFRAPGLRSATAAVAFAVSDTGIGIPPDKQRIIFEAFQQGDPSVSRAFGGTGLGLTISRELARLLGGEITLDSTPDKGSTFTLVLPLTDGDRVGAREGAPLRVAPERPPVGAAPAEGASTATTPAIREQAHEGAPVGKELAGRIVLVVDDDVRNLFAVTSTLESHGAIPLSASCAHEALHLLEQRHDVDAVLMDIMMPEVDGYEATRRIRAMPKLTCLPVIALTAKAMPGDREKCIEAGCNDFVAKPVDSAGLVAAVVRALSEGGG